MSRPTNTEARRAEIARGLLKVMSTKGYDGATVQDIARAARLSPGLVHYHFGSKQEVLEALLDDLMAQHAARLEVALARAGSTAFEKVVSFLDAHLATGATADADALSVWVSLGAEALKSAEVRARFVRALTASRDRLVAIIDDGQRRRQLGAVDAASAAAALLATIEGYFVIAATARELIPHSSAAPAARAMAEGLLKPRRRS